MVRMLSTRAGAVQVNCALARLGLAAAFLFVLAVVVGPLGPPRVPL